MSERLKVGFDFGTSNSAIATVENNRVRLFANEEGKPTEPSVIFIRVDGYLSVGNQAILDFQDPGKLTDAYHFIPSIKTGLPEELYLGNVLRSKKTRSNGRFISRFFPVDELGSSLIGHLKERAEQATGKEAKNVVLGRPVRFSDDVQKDKMAQDRLEAAAKKAGFQEVHFVLEPVAAALYYEKFFSSGKPHKIFVFDFGGGTLDVSILEIEGKDPLSMGDFSNTVLGSNGIRLGGTDLDKDVFRAEFLNYFGSGVTYGPKALPMPNHLYLNITEWHLQEFMHKNHIIDMLNQILTDPICSDREAVCRMIALISDQQVYSVLNAIEVAKIQLTSQREGQIQHIFKNIDIHEPLSREKFEAIVRPRIIEIEDCIKECLKQAQVDPGDIDVVLKTGGSSNNVFIESLLRRIFPSNIRSTDVFTSVAAGLALASDQFFD